MAIRVYGIDPSVDEVQWAKIGYDAGRAGTYMGVGAGLTCAPSATAMTSLVAAGQSYQANTRAPSDAAVPVLHGGNAGANPRLDVICMRVDWGGLIDTAGTLVVVPGTPGATPQLPGLTQNPGVLWYTPLYSVLIDAGKTTGVIAAGKYTDLRPKPSQRSWGGVVTITVAAGGTASGDVKFPYGYFSQPPASVVVGIGSGQGPNTTGAPWVVPGSITKDGCTISVSRSVAAAVDVHYSATGILN